MDQPTAPNINILSFKQHEETTLGGFLSWSLRYGRIIIIVTEFLVIAAFLSRFYFDRKLSDLNDAINAKTAFIEQSQTTEKEFLTFQATTAQAGKIIAEQKDFSKLIVNLTSNVPQDLIVKEINLKLTSITLVAQTASTNTLQAFLQSLTTGGKFSDVTIEDISQKDGQLLTTISAKIDKNAF